MIVCPHCGIRLLSGRRGNQVRMLVDTTVRNLLNYRDEVEDERKATWQDLANDMIDKHTFIGFPRFSDVNRKEIDRRLRMALKKAKVDPKGIDDIAKVMQVKITSSETQYPTQIEIDKLNKEWARRLYKLGFRADGKWVAPYSQDKHDQEGFFNITAGLIKPPFSDPWGGGLKTYSLGISVTEGKGRGGISLDKRGGVFTAKDLAGAKKMMDKATKYVKKWLDNSMAA